MRCSLRSPMPADAPAQRTMTRTRHTVRPWHTLIFNHLHAYVALWDHIKLPHIETHRNPTCEEATASRRGPHAAPMMGAPSPRTPQQSSAGRLTRHATSASAWWQLVQCPVGSSRPTMRVQVVQSTSSSAVRWADRQHTRGEQAVRQQLGQRDGKRAARITVALTL
jgi:hypothetical protein